MSQKPLLWRVGVVLLLFIPGAGRTAYGGQVEDLRPSDRETLRTYANDTWKSLAAMADDGELPADGLRRSQNGTWRSTPKTTPTDIACYLWSTVAAHRLGIISEGESLRRLGRTLSGVERMERVHGFFYDKIDPRTCKALRRSPYDGQPIELILSCVDNAWLATALMVVRNACPTLRERAEALLRPMDFGFFYLPYDATDPRKHPGLLHGPYWVDRRDFGGVHLVLNTEQRITGYIGIARGQIPRELYYRAGRVLESVEFQQSQKPEGEYRTYLGIRVFEGHYRYRGMRIVPSWGGSMFEALMVTLFVPEEQWAPRSWGVNHRLYVRAQIEHGLDEARYGFWGFSPAANPEGGYRTYGVDALGMDPAGYASGNDDTPAGRGPAQHPARSLRGVVTPHASFLALRFATRPAMANLSKLMDSFPVYGEYGFMDSVDVSKGIVSDTVLALDQGMIMAAIANALVDDVMRHAFCDGDVERVIRPLIGPEEFTAGDEPPAPRQGQ